jgi:putative spermidine/putrescine transport system substrate-binding protein
MAALVAAAKKEGTLNLIAVPRSWAGYGAIIDAFKAKYGLKINSENPNGASADEITAVKSTKGQDSAPDVLDVGNSYALDGAQSGLFAPYKVATWTDIPDALKDSGGLWYSDYGGYLSIGCNAAKVGGTCPKTIKDLDNPAYKDKVALNGDPTEAAAAFSGVWAAALANGGSADDIQPGIDFFKKLNQDGNFNKTQASPQTVQSGETPIVLDWDYLNAGYAPTLKKAGITWTTVVPTDGLVSSFYSQAISLTAAHPAAARLWEEFLYSQDKDGGQNGWLRGYARPIELPVMLKNGTADKAAADKLPTVTDTKPFAPTQAQITAAQNVVKKNWAAAVA